jgi:hypothetical protein
MFYQQNKDFGHTSFCKKYYCSTSTDVSYDPPGSKIVERIKTIHSTFEMGYKDRFDVFRSAFYAVISIRRPLYGPNKYAPTAIGLEMSSDVRYSSQMRSYLDKNQIEPRTEQLINDFLKTTIGKTYPRSKLLTCLRLKSSRYELETDYLDAPKGSPIRTIRPLGPNPSFPFYRFTVGCESERDLITIAFQ